jgi:homoserine dehydrogenase
VGESTQSNVPILPIGTVVTRYQITLSVADRPGVLSQIAALFSDHDVSVEAVQQSVATARGQESGARTATLVIVTHEALESSLAATVESVARHDAVERVVSVLRVEGETA